MPWSTSVATLLEKILSDISLKQKTRGEKHKPLCVPSAGKHPQEQQHLGWMKAVQKCSQLHPMKLSIISISLHEPSPAVAQCLLSGGNSKQGKCTFHLLPELISRQCFPTHLLCFCLLTRCSMDAASLGCSTSEMVGNESLELRMGQASGKQPGRSPGLKLRVVSKTQADPDLLVLAARSS